MSQKTITQRFQRKDILTHCLTRPDMYVGSNTLYDIEDFIAENKDGEYRITKKTIQFSPAILRVFIEVISNAIDNCKRSSKTKNKCSEIRVTLDEKTGETSVWNDGNVVPIAVHEEEKCYVHSLIFGQVMTGENYDDNEERETSGRNGYGVKLCNIYSKKFTVEGVDPKRKKKFIQTWTTNMRNTEEPTVTKTEEKRGYTKVTWTPDFDWFGLENGYTKDIINLYQRYVIDMAMLTGVNVYFNNKLIPVKTLKDYGRLYEESNFTNIRESVDTENEEEEDPTFLYIKTKTCQVLLVPSDSFESITFVNGIYTRLGGQHLSAWTEALFRPIVEKINTKYGKQYGTTSKININHVKNCFRIFVVATVIRPKFNGQDKTRLEYPEVEAKVKKTSILKILKWPIISKLEDIFKLKSLSALKKKEKSMKKEIIDNYDKANKSGGVNSHLCSLFVCEGLSAKTYVVAGIDEGVYGKSGRDWFGVFPIRGKVLNVREQKISAIVKNKIICSLIGAIGLKIQTDYTVEKNFKTLNYGKIIVAADADKDGIHIEGLILNFIHALYPSLLRREEKFVCSMKTPVARIILPRKKDLLFFDEMRFVHWLSEQKKKPNIKYYKGLGTTKVSDVPDTFGLKMLEFNNDEKAEINMNKAFHKAYSDKRKEWVGNYNINEQKFSLDDTKNIHRMDISDFVNHELIKFSHYNCSRTIPNGIDGLKTCQRKILYAVKKRKLKYSGKTLKVAQLAGYTAEHSSYHHGEQNLFETIVGLAQEFPGSNNIPLLYRDGMFGTRLESGKDSASARYIYTKMDALTEYIYREEDEPLLTPVQEDGDYVQPEFYVPIIPMICINGCNAGIGTGWSTKIPSFNPKTIIRAIHCWLEWGHSFYLEDPDTEEKNLVFEEELIPWYRGYTGNIEFLQEKKFISYGTIEEGKGNRIEITELPVGMSVNSFKKFLEKLKKLKKITKYDNYSSTKKIRFVIHENDTFVCNLDNLKLHKYIHLSNMVMFDENDQVKRYKNIFEIIDNFCKIRFQYYTKRKAYVIQNQEKILRTLGNKERFIREVIDKTILIMNKEEEKIIEKLEERKFDKDENDSFNYLLRMPVRTFTANKVRSLNNEIKSAQTVLDNFRNKNEKDMWISDLDEFEREYDKWLVQMEKEDSKNEKKQRKRKTTRKK